MHARDIYALRRDISCEEDKLTLTNARLLKANLGNPSTFSLSNTENKIQAHSRFARPRTNPATAIRNAEVKYSTENVPPMVYRHQKSVPIDLRLQSTIVSTPATSFDEFSNFDRTYRLFPVDGFLQLALVVCERARRAVVTRALGVVHAHLRLVQVFGAGVGARRLGSLQHAEMLSATERVPRTQNASPRTCPENAERVSGTHRDNTSQERIPITRCGNTS